MSGSKNMENKEYPICLNCGKEIKTKSHHANCIRKYCSNKCFREARGCSDRIWHYTTCQYCGKTFKEQRDRANLYCSVKCASKAKAARDFRQKEIIEEHKKELFDEYTELIRKAEQIRFKIEHEKYCKVCGKLFIGKTTTSVCCSPECSKKNDNRKKDKRLYKNGQPDLSINLTRLYKRDNGICQLCGKHIDFDCDWNSDDYPSIDHIIPIAKGGMHQWDNVQLACRGCNTFKGVKVI